VIFSSGRVESAGPCQDDNLIFSSPLFGFSLSSTNLASAALGDTNKTRIYQHMHYGRYVRLVPTNLVLAYRSGRKYERAVSRDVVLIT
jgi:hypothetical protein